MVAERGYDPRTSGLWAQHASTARNGQERLPVPKKLRSVIFAFYHESLYGCHLGIDKTVSKIKSYFHWPGLNSYVKTKIEQCLTCQRIKTDQSGKKGVLSSTVYSYPGQRLFVDIAGALPSSGIEGYKYILIAVDAFTRFTFFVPLRRLSSETVMKALERHIFQHFGHWDTVCTDNASIFISQKFKTFLFNKGIQRVPLIRFYPNPNIAERQIKTLKTAISAYYAEHQSEWAKSLHFFQLCINSAIHSSTGFSPNRLFLGREVKTPLLLRWDICSDHQDATSQTDMWKQALENLKAAHTRIKRQYDGAHTKVEYNIDDVVLLKTYILSDKAKQINKKLAYKYSDPYKIIRKKSPVTYSLQKLDDPGVIREAHVSQMKIYRIPRH
ncbi:unnamed protein product [Nesidiocoris tenuis]|uniref:RNA-directed DNA polymerase n=1 Tax=Nesidiocoris tenuis TaxID=355587 RepID=A0A6H5HFC4_9HEMI|nr:unnamed protein product [Nesidiocoris tenuis]